MFWMMTFLWLMSLGLLIPSSILGLRSLKDFYPLLLFPFFARISCHCELERQPQNNLTLNNSAISSFPDLYELRLTCCCCVIKRPFCSLYFLFWAENNRSHETFQFFFSDQKLKTQSSSIQHLLFWEAVRKHFLCFFLEKLNSKEVILKTVTD